LNGISSSIGLTHTYPVSSLPLFLWLAPFLVKTERGADSRKRKHLPPVNHKHQFQWQLPASEAIKLVMKYRTPKESNPSGVEGSRSGWGEEVSLPMLGS